MDFGGKRAFRAGRALMKSDLRRIVVAARSRGWSVSYTGTGHLRLLHPNGAVVVAGGTPSDWRAHRNFQADLRRAERRTCEQKWPDKDSDQ
jgi:hypothetical protein